MPLLKRSKPHITLVSHMPWFVPYKQYWRCTGFMGITGYGNNPRAAWDAYQEVLALEGEE